jgi:hypothetical protein
MFKDLSTTGAQTDQDEESTKEMFAQDIFDLGYILLVSATGGLDLINHESLDFSKKDDT